MAEEHHLRVTTSGWARLSDVASRPDAECIRYFKRRGMVTAGTIEERIQALKASKRDLFDKLIGGLGGDFDLSQHFSSLRGLVSLTAEMEPEPLHAYD
jgi:hypothetical protein